MKKKILVFALLFALFAPSTSFAAINRVFVEPVFATGDGVSVNVAYFEDDSQMEQRVVSVPASAYVDNLTLQSAIQSAVFVDASNRGYTLSKGMQMQTLTQADIQAAIASTTNQSDWTQTSTSSPGYIKNKPSMSFSTTSVTLGTAFQVATTSAADIRGSFRIANVLTLTGGAAGDIVMEQADNSGFTTNVVELGRCGNSNTGGLVVGLTLNDAVGCQVSGIVEKGKYVRFRSITTTGTPTYTVLGARQVLLGY